ncbi:MAG: DEAD/DEAH box helicase [Parachlamydiales bacterium]|jgi:ATP-dependent RNA helicase DeaD
MTTFIDFGLDPLILQALEKMNYKEPSAIQARAIPLILEQRDVIALAQTGSGKTAACAIPVSHNVRIDFPHIQALIVVPTRELALQYATETQKIGQIKGVKAFALYGGEQMDLQKSKLRAGVHVLIATPGRLIDFIYNRLIDLSHVETLILDEADEMLSMGFQDDLEFIINCLVQKHQTLLFSATMPGQIRKIAHAHMKDPLEVTLTKEDASPQTLEHRFVYCHSHDRDAQLMKLLKDLQPHQSLVFCHSRIECESVCRLLQRHFDKVDFLHAGLTQDIRSIVTNKFRNGRISCLVATDVAARGLDFSNISHVFMHHLASDPEVYVHRSGRAGRNGKQGMAVALVTPRDLGTVVKLLKLVQRDVEWIGDPPPAFPPQPGASRGGSGRGGPPRGGRRPPSRPPRNPA